MKKVERVTKCHHPQCKLCKSVEVGVEVGEKVSQGPVQSDEPKQGTRGGGVRREVGTVLSDVCHVWDTVRRKD